METSTIVTIVVAAAGGYLFGLLDRWVTQKVRKKPEKTPPPQIVEVFKENNLPGESTVMKVTVDQASKWHVEVDGTRLDNPAALTPEQRQRVVTTVVQIRPWIDGKVAAQAPAAAPTPPPVQQPAPARPAPAPQPQQPVAQTPPPPRPVSTPAPMPAVAPIKPDLGNSLRSLIKTDSKPPEAAKSNSIVAMIDRVLQTKIPGTKFANMGVRLEEGSLGEVIVYVGASRYPGIDAVPDPEVQALIRSAIADWEKH